MSRCKINTKKGKSNMNSLQMEILKIYNEFKRICSKYNLKYFAIGGTCIGAIRHKGFIPWDDDIDVAMPIGDYFKFKEVAKIELNKPYELIDYMNNDSHFQYFLKIQNVNTTYIENAERYNKKRYKGIFIDIMPLIGSPCNKEKQKLFMTKIIFYRKLNDIRNHIYSERISLKSKISWLLCRPILSFFKSNYFITKWNNLLTEYSLDKNNMVMMPWRVPIVRPYCTFFPFDYFSEVSIVPFENTEMPIPKEYDKYLKDDFGDYMKLPPKEKQISIHNVAKISLEKSYKEYNPSDFR